MTDPESPPATCPNLAHWLPPAAVAEQLGVTHLNVLGWITTGVRTDTGRARLPAVKLGGRWRVDPAQVGTFVKRMTALALGEGEDVLPPPPSARADKRRIASSMARLRAAGVIPEPEAQPERVKGKGGRRHPREQCQ